MLAKRIIPCLDVKDGRVVKGVNYVNLADAGDPAEQAARYEEDGADELVILDISASEEGRQARLATVRAVARRLTIPLTVGGGIRTLEDITELLRAGADKVSVNTAAWRDPDLITRGAARFGRQCIVVAVDARRVTGVAGGVSDGVSAGGAPADRAPANGVPTGEQPGLWEARILGGKESTGQDAVVWAAEAERRGAGEILLTSIDRDGTNQGYDISLTHAVAEAVHIPVIASGGGGTAAHAAEVLTEGRADAALYASSLHYRKLTVRAIKEHLADLGIEVRL